MENVKNTLWVAGKMFLYLHRSFPYLAMQFSEENQCMGGICNIFHARLHMHKVLLIRKCEVLQVHYCIHRMCASSMLGAAPT
jgi:hypothetical protein